ncbi:MAG: alpha/beta hydrolase [Flavobacteriaceae bacterium]|nr:alpha/beta hydrolase [Flavobacteriaceae bacterium]
MKTKKMILILICSIYSVCSFGQNYIFFLHNRFIEEHHLEEEHPEYGKAEYLEILNEFKKEGFKVFSEKRSANTDVKEYAKKIVAQIDSLLLNGLKPAQITVIRTSKGGYIAQYVSTFLNNPEVNFIFIGSFRDIDIKNLPDINFCGNILTIYEKTDVLGVSAIKRKETSSLKVSRFKEIELNTGLRHGFLFKPLREWIYPSIQWAKQNYELN